jgi:hypothetical protein
VDGGDGGVGRVDGEVQQRLRDLVAGVGLVQCGGQASQRLLVVTPPAQFSLADRTEAGRGHRGDPDHGQEDAVRQLVELLHPTASRQQAGGHGLQHAHHDE